MTIIYLDLNQYQESTSISAQLEKLSNKAKYKYIAFDHTTESVGQLQSTLQELLDKGDEHVKLISFNGELIHNLMDIYGSHPLLSTSKHSGGIIKNAGLVELIPEELTIPSIELPLSLDSLPELIELSEYSPYGHMKVLIFETESDAGSVEYVPYTKELVADLLAEDSQGLVFPVMQEDLIQLEAEIDASQNEYEVQAILSRISKDLYDRMQSVQKSSREDSVILEFLPTFIEADGYHLPGEKLTIFVQKSTEEVKDLASVYTEEELDSVELPPADEDMAEGTGEVELDTPREPIYETHFELVPQLTNKLGEVRELGGLTIPRVSVVPLEVVCDLHITEEDLDTVAQLMAEELINLPLKFTSVYVSAAGSNSARRSSILVKLESAINKFLTDSGKVGLADSLTYQIHKVKERSRFTVHGNSWKVDVDKPHKDYMETIQLLMKKDGFMEQLQDSILLDLNSGVSQYEIKGYEHAVDPHYLQSKLTHANLIVELVGESNYIIKGIYFNEVDLSAPIKDLN